MKTAAVLVIAIVAQALGNVYLTKAMKSVTSGGGDLIATALRAASDPMVWLGTALLIVFFALYSAALSWADLSFVLPATAFGYVLNVAAGHYFLNETVTPARWAGSVVITLGVVLVSRSGARTVTQAAALRSGASEISR
ncbi:MAG TPA: EamA family transporter [Blastocatellia bacterium]|nr:EamA family transporter [Blastocatellia bacterium]